MPSWHSVTRWSPVRFWKLQSMCQAVIFSRPVEAKKTKFFFCSSISLELDMMCCFLYFYWKDFLILKVVGGIQPEIVVNHSWCLIWQGEAEKFERNYIVKMHFVYLLRLLLSVHKIWLLLFKEANIDNRIMNYKNILWILFITDTKQHYYKGNVDLRRHPVLKCS